jgi:ADP-heptose:LPS heptosyltransferase
MLRILERFFKRGFALLLKLFFRSSPPADLDDFSPKSILVIRQHNQLGDMLCAVPLLRGLRGRYPSAKISLLASPVNYQIMLHSRFLDEVILYEKREYLENGRLHPKNLLRFIRSLWGAFDMVVVPGTVSTSFTSDLLAFCTRARVRIGVESLDGRDNPSAFLYNAPVALDWHTSPHRHQTLRNLDILAPIKVRVDDLSHEITLTDEEVLKGKRETDRMRAGRRYLFGFHPGAGKPQNRWPSEKFVQIIASLGQGYNCTQFITAGPMDADVLKSILIEVNQKIEVVENKSIREIASIIKQVDLFISNDTGILHVAAGVGVPLIGLFGPTDPLQWAPMGHRIRYIQGEGGIIDAIGVDDVLRIASEVLQKDAS